ncbi:hypothetical protein BY458DRAFT_449827 [Sporodiniella umbellata]|nr:hypothetical protein BY458DRAFT_449827 [Sporodiniella umbellata]
MIASLITSGKKRLPKTASDLNSFFKCHTRINCLSIRSLSGQSKFVDIRPSKDKPNDYKKKNKNQFIKAESPFVRGNRPTHNKNANSWPSDPYKSSEKVKAILDKGSVNDAHEYLKTLPTRLQSEVVWNHLIGRCAKEGRSQEAERLFAEMRRRGMPPNEWTFAHLISVYSKSNSANSVEKAEEWLKKMKPYAVKTSIVHLNNLLMVYNRTQNYSKTVKLLDDMPNRGIRPDATTYSIGLRACTELKKPGQAAGEIRCIWQSISRRLDTSIAENGNINAGVLGLESIMDDELIISLVTAIGYTSTKESDMIPGLEAIHKLYSLLPPSSAALIKKHQLYGEINPHGFGIEPSLSALDSILRFCGRLREYTLGREFYELAIQQYPKIQPDNYLTDAYEWLKKMENSKPYKKAYNRK